MEIADLVFIDSTGYHYSDYPAFLAFFQDKYRTIYGADIYIEADSQDGQSIAAEAKAAFDTAALGASIYNSFSPVSSQGTGLSRNVKINGISRRDATNSTVELLITGTVGTVINNGIAIDTLNQQWMLPNPTTIPFGGTITVTATAKDIGAINALPSTINRIFTPTRGWQSVNNVAAATAGVAIETDAELRIRQRQSTANPSLTVMDGTMGAVENVTGVVMARGYENDTGSTDANGIPAHSIAVVVSGGDDTAIAETIALHKTPGTRTFGTTSVAVTDAHDMPLTIHFYRPTQKTITVDIEISVTSDFISDYEDLIKKSVADYINAIGIGNDVLITKLYVPAYLPGNPAGATFDITELEIAISPGSPSNVNLDILFNQVAVCDPTADITITVV